ncbi:MAG: helicase RepA family protein, partial [Acetobacteraceae bacterium]|nr:helicase RepA family protein [Acetobacteraceae bacterium]
MRDRGIPFGRLRLLTLGDAELAPPRSYLLDGLLAPGELSVWWGAPKSGKSFLLTRIAYGLALGRGMWGLAARGPTRVLYLSAEGESGFAGRLLALAAEFGPADGFGYVAQRAEVGPPGGDLADLIAAAKHHRADIIVLDTVARTFGTGDESGTRDMGAYVAALDRLREETGAHIVVVHHGSKNGESPGPRGSIALVGAADLVVKVERGKDGAPHRATVEAAKDDADGATFAFRLRVVEMERRHTDRKPRTTCITEEAEAVPPSPTSGLPPQARDALGFLRDLVAAQGSPLPAIPGFPAGLQGVAEARWREECETRRLSTAEKPEDRRRTFRNAFKLLRERQIVAARDGL